MMRNFWKKLAEKPYDEQLTAFYMPEVEEALVRDPVDGYDPWAVRENSRLAVAKKNFKIGKQRNDGKRGLAWLEITELYEVEDQRLLREKVEKRAQTRGRQKLCRDVDGIELEVCEKRIKLRTRRNPAVMFPCCAIRICRHL